MANLSSFSVLNQYVNGIKDYLDLEHVGIAFDHSSLELILKLNEHDIEDALTDGPDDGGIDAITILNREVHVFNMKYTYDFKNTDKNFPGVEIDKLISTLSAFISANLEKDSINDEVFQKYLEIKALYQEGPLRFHIYLVSNKQKPIDSAKKKLEKALSIYRFIEFHYYDMEDLVRIILENQQKKTDGALTLLNKYHFEKSDAGIKTIIGVIAAQDLIELIKDREDEHKVNQFIFNENIRTYRENHSINKGIIDSALSEENYQFFYLNNGITLLCEEAEYQPNIRNPRVVLKNVQIINGGQTSHSLFEAYKKNNEKISDIDLLVRICEINPEDPITSKISETTNKQIPVGTRDLHSNDLIQRKIEADFRLMGYYYERKPGQHKDKPRNNVLNNELLGQLYMAFYLNKPSEAKNNKNLVFGDLYEDIFNDESIDAKLLLKLYKLYVPLLEMKKNIQRKKRKKEAINEKEAFVSRATFHILNGMRIISNCEGQELENSYVNEAMKKSTDYIFEIVGKEMERRGELYTHDKFFKEIPTNKIIIDHIEGKY